MLGIDHADRPAEAVRHQQGRVGFAAACRARHAEAQFGAALGRAVDFKWFHGEVFLLSGGWGKGADRGADSADEFLHAADLRMPLQTAVVGS